MSAADMEMKCDDYRQAIAGDPAESFEGGAEHASGCADCCKYRSEIRSLDQSIARALAIDVPQLTLPDLPAIDDDNVVSLPYRKRGPLSTRSWIGVAASVAIAAVLAVRFLGPGPVYASLGDEVLAHLDHEPRAVRVTDEAVSERRLTRVTSSDVEDFDASVGLVTYARTCVINGNRIPHLVIQGERGPVTLLLLPDEMIGAAETLKGEGVEGVILPVGDGSIAIIGERDEQLDKIEKRLLETVKWRT